MVTKRQLNKLKRKMRFDSIDKFDPGALSEEERKSKIKELKDILKDKYTELQNTDDSNLTEKEQRIKELSLKLEGDLVGNKETN